MISKPSSRVFTVPPGVPFLRALAQALCAGGFPHVSLPPPDPVALAGYRVLLPTRRASRAFMQTFVDIAPADALLLPHIAPLGDVDEDELSLLGEVSAGGSDAAELPLAISPLERRLLLTRFILEWERGRQAETGEARLHSPAQASYLANELARLIDAVETEQADWSALEALVDGEFSAHWGEILDFLDVLRRRLPHELEARGLLNPMARRNLALKASADRLRSSGDKTPIVAAGSTGSIPATAELLKTIAGLENGAVVLPGLDRSMGERSWHEVGPDHPQYGMRQLLERLGISRDDVAVLPGVEEDAGREARTRMLAEVMRPAGATDVWRDQVAANDAIGGMHTVTAPTQREEALAIALILRDVLEVPGRTGALVTPDRRLARRVSSELRRWNIVIDDTAGEPLQGTPQGSLARVVAEAAESGWAPVHLLALLKHPLAHFGRERGEVLKLTQLLELAALRGAVAPQGFTALASALARTRQSLDTEGYRLPRAVQAMTADDWEHVGGFVDKLSAVLQPFADALATSKALGTAALITAHAEVLEAITLAPAADVPLVWQDEGGEALAELFSALLEARDLVPELSVADYGPFFAGLMQGRLVRTRNPGHPRVQILGLLEARLLQADVMVLGGLNEGVWPQISAADPFLNRPMRRDFGLEPPERRIGLAAHDFVQGLNGAKVYLTWSEKIDGAPVGPSRWILRLQVLMGSGEAIADRRWIAWALGLDHVEEATPVRRPMPRPDVGKRPRALSVTRIEEWVRDPYAAYARHILQLKPVDRLAGDPGAADRGTLIHDILHRYALESFPNPPAEPLERLLDLGRAEFADYLEFPEVAAFWWARFERIAEWLIESGAFDVEGVNARVAEISGRAVIDAPAGPFKLTARADRIDVTDDAAIIFDYKTGAAPSQKQMMSGLAPQMPLEAAIALRGGFKDVAADSVSDLVYLRLTGGATPGERRGLLRADANELAQAAYEGLARWIARFDDADTPYVPRAVPEFEYRAGDFDHLSRHREWTRTGDQGGEM